MVVEHQAIKLTPPALLLKDCTAPEAPQHPATNLDLLKYAIGLKTSLDGCNGDKRALRAWADGHASDVRTLMEGWPE